MLLLALKAANAYANSSLTALIFIGINILFTSYKHNYSQCPISWSLSGKFETK